MTTPHDRDPYTGQDLGPIERRELGEIPDTGYERTTPNPCYRGLPAATLRLDPDGAIARVDIQRKADLPEHEKARLVREQLERQGRRRKVKGPGDAPRPPKPEVPQIRDLMGALKASLEAGTAGPPAPLCESSRGDKMRKPTTRAGSRGALSHAHTRDTAHDGAQGTEETNRSHTRGNRMTTATAPNTSAGGQPLPRPVLTLYDISERLHSIEAFIDENADAIIAAKGDLDAIPGLVEQLELVEGEFTAKVERVVLFIQNRAALEGVRRKQAESFARMADVDRNVVASLKAYLVRCQRRAGKPKVETSLVISRVQKNSAQSVERAKEAATLEAIHDLAAYRLDLVHAGTVTASILECIEIERPAPVYSLNREKVLEIWLPAYEQALKDATAEGSFPTEHDRDLYAQTVANRHPVLVALEVTVTQGFHIRIK